MYLDYFKQGKITKLSTSRILDEGVDVPDASVAVIISGSGSSRVNLIWKGDSLEQVLRPLVKYHGSFLLHFPTSLNNDGVPVQSHFNIIHLANRN